MLEALLWDSFRTSLMKKRVNCWKKGDVLVIYTDGVTEAVNKDEKMFCVERLHSLIRENAHLDAESLINLIYDSVLEFSKGIPQFDDITLMALKIEE